MAELIYLDDTPTPRIYPMLGEIPLKNWQCIAEFIDNSIDSFEYGGNLSESEIREIHVTIPTETGIVNNEPIIIQDFGLGMTKDQLEKSIKAGYSGQRVKDKLGLFGMGFNVASNRLAWKVAVWTSTKDDNKSIGVVIDRRGQSAGTFKHELLNSDEHDFSELGKSGTRIELSKFKKGINIKRSRIIRELKNVYSSSLFERYRVKILINNETLIGKQYCIWDPEKRSVQAAPTDSSEQDLNTIPTKINIPEITIRKVAYCSICLNEIMKIQENEEDLPSECTECQATGSIELREYKIGGWLGIQRFCDESLYGIDIVRNGRIIVQNSKEFFYWELTEEHNLSEEQLHYLEAHKLFSSTNSKLAEYPIDYPELGGRIVGEVYADFIKTTYTKDDFERGHITWRNAFNHVRGSNPMQPVLARRNLGLTETNTSPLAILYRAYKKVNVGINCMLCGGLNNLGQNAANDLAKDYYKLWLTGEELYQNDEKWFELVKQSERQIDENEVPGALDTDNPDDSVTPEEENEPIDDYPGDKTFVREIVIDLESKTRVEARKYFIYDWKPRENQFPPIIMNEAGRDCHVYLNAKNTIVNLFQENWEDLFCIEVANDISYRSNNREYWTPAAVYLEIKKRYFKEYLLEPNQLIIEGNRLINDIIDFLTEGDFTLNRSTTLTDDEINTINSNYLDLHNRELTNIEDLILTSGYLRYVNKLYVFKFIEDDPSLILDEHFFQYKYEILENLDLRIDVKSRFLGDFSQIKWIINVLPDLNNDQIRKNKSTLVKSKNALQELIANRVAN